MIWQFRIVDENRESLDSFSCIDASLLNPSFTSFTPDIGDKEE
jgi:hypothetical protein